MIYFLLIMLIIIFLLEFFLEKDLLAPSCLLTTAYIVSVILILIRKNAWGVTLNSNTIEILLYSTVLFFIVYTFFRCLLIKKKMNVDNKKSYEEGFIVIEESKVNILIIINAVIFFIYMVFFIDVIRGVSFNSFSEMMHYYRLNTAYGDGLENEIPQWVMHLKKINWATAYIFLYVIVYNYIYSKKEKIQYKINYKYIVLLLLYLPLTILSGGRFDLIVFCISTVALWYIIDRHFNNSSNIEFKKIFKMILLFLLILIIFSISRNLVGRNNESNFIDYIAMYFGAPIVNFDYYINTIEGLEYETFGREIFKSIYSILSKIVDINLEELTREFVVINGHSLGNVYTAYKYMYSAAGIPGIIVFQSLLAVFFAIFYTRIKNIKRLDTIRCDLIIYSVVIYAIILHPFSEFLFSTILSFNYILFTLLLILLKIILLTKKEIR